MTNRTRKLTLIAVIVAVTGIGALAWAKFFRELPQQLADGTTVEYFKYGSVGTEADAGIPYWIWVVLPKMFPEYLPRPGGWAALGFGWEQGREMPVGFSKKTIGFERVGVNCALCHSATLRTAAGDVPRVYPGAPSNAADILGYQRFLFQSASDPRFNSSNILREIGQIYRMSWLDRVLYRFVLVPATRKALLTQKEAFAWTDVRPDWGRGRIDPFNPVKVNLLGVDVGDTIGNSDMMPIWNMRPRVEHEMAFHWDGLNTNLTEVFLSSALGDGATPGSLPIGKLAELQEWAMDLAPPRFAELFDVDAGLAASGEAVFRRNCASCHAFGEPATGKVRTVSGGDWGGAPTDAHRADMWTDEAASAYNAYAEGYEWDFDEFRSTGGYLNVPLDGLWMRAPYLHNGSVPYLSDLLEPPRARPRVFYRGYDVYDPQRVGFVAEGPEAARVGTRYDVSETGNSNRGHLWGTELGRQEKRALLEYLKTL